MITRTLHYRDRPTRISKQPCVEGDFIEAMKYCKNLLKTLNDAYEGQVFSQPYQNETIISWKT